MQRNGGWGFHISHLYCLKNTLSDLFPVAPTEQPQGDC